MVEEIRDVGSDQGNAIAVDRGSGAVVVTGSYGNSVDFGCG